MAQMDPATAYLVVNLSVEDKSTLKFRVRTFLSTPTARFSLRVPGIIIFYVIPKVQNFGREKFDELEIIRQIRQTFPPSNFCAIWYFKLANN